MMSALSLFLSRPADEELYRDLVVSCRWFIVKQSNDIVVTERRKGYGTFEEDLRGIEVFTHSEEQSSLADEET